MSTEYERQLEAQIDGALKRLPELQAPATLAPRILELIAARAAAPWYRRSWQTWPFPWRLVSLMTLIALFGALCFGGWQLEQGASFAAIDRQVAIWSSFARTLWETFNLLLGAGGLILKHLGTGFIVTCLAALALGYGVCLALGTAFLRVASAAVNPRFKEA
jgi:hypothetical protein